MASPSPTRRRCLPRRSLTLRSGFCFAPYANFSAGLERYLRAGKRPELRLYPLSNGDAAQPHRWHGRDGRDRPGDCAPARRHERAGRLSFRGPSRPPRAIDHYPKLLDMAREVVTVLLVITPGGAETKNLINAEVLKSLGPRRHPHQHGARFGGRRGGADPGAQGQDHPVGRARCLPCASPRVLPELTAMDHVVLFPHLGSASAPHPHPDGSARGRQSSGLGGRQAAAHPGARDAVAGQPRLVLLRQKPYVSRPSLKRVQHARLRRATARAGTQVQIRQIHDLSPLDPGSPAIARRRRAYTRSRLARLGHARQLRRKVRSP